MKLIQEKIKRVLFHSMLIRRINIACEVVISHSTTRIISSVSFQQLQALQSGLYILGKQMKNYSIHFRN